MSESSEKPVDEPAAVVPDDTTEVRPPAADLAGGAAAVTPAAEPEGDAVIGGATPAPVAEPAPVVEPAPAAEPAPAEPAAAEAPVPPAAETVTPPPATTWTPPDPPQDPASAGVAAGTTAVVHDRPEIAIAGAFGGGLVLALILKRLAR